MRISDWSSDVCSSDLRNGIPTKVDTMPKSVYFKRASALEFSFILVGWGSGTGEASSPLKSLLATYNKEKGMGASNRGRYSNPEFDKILEQALATVADEKRAALLQKAHEIGIGHPQMRPPTQAKLRIDHHQPTAGRTPTPTPHT